MLRKCVALFSLLLLAAVPGFAQEESDWEILLYAQTQIHILTANGISGQIELPEEVQQMQPFTGLGSIQLSPDRSHLAFTVPFGAGEGVAPSAGIFIADLDAGTCCVTVVGPETMVADAVTVGPFSPDSSQFVANFAQIYSPGGGDPVLAIIDVESGMIVQQIDMLDSFNDQGAWFMGWDEAGIKLFPTCLACGGVPEGFLSRWDPVTGEIERNVEYVNFFGTGLRATGEYLIPRRDESLPVSNDDGMFPPPNVLDYLPSGDPDDSTLVYFDPEMTNLPFPYWVADGAAYLLHDWNMPSATLVFRDGSKQSVDLPENLHFVAGTPDGWLMQAMDYIVYQFQIVEGGLISSSVLMPESDVVILSAPPLGDETLGPVTPVIG